MAIITSALIKSATKPLLTDDKDNRSWAVVVAQLAERSLPTPEIRGSNPDIGNISNVFICQLLSRKDENKEKEAGNGPLKK